MNRPLSRSRSKNKRRIKEERSMRVRGGGLMRIVKVNSDFYERTCTSSMNASFIGTENGWWMGVSHGRRYLRVIPAAELKWPMNFLVTFFFFLSLHFSPPTYFHHHDSTRWNCRIIVFFKNWRDRFFLRKIEYYRFQRDSWDERFDSWNNIPRFFAHSRIECW